MGVIESSTYAGGILTTKYDNSKLLIFNNSFTKGNVNNSTYDDVVLAVGTLMGRISATGLLTPLKSGASDGSQVPVGVLAGGFTIEDGTTKEVTLVVSGEIDESKIVFDGSDTLETVISGRRLKDMIAGDTVGLILKSVNELSEFDND